MATGARVLLRLLYRNRGASHLGGDVLLSSPRSDKHEIILVNGACTSDLSYRGEACQHLDLDLVGLEVKGHFRIRKVQPDVQCSRK
jgi:hypothetical protein